jgi:putative ABC transport system permease protein
MLSNHFKIAIRNLKQNSLFSILNISGLAVGLGTSLLILIWVQDERSYDRYHAHADRTFRINAHFKSGDEVDIWAGAPAPHAAYALRDFPEVERAVRLMGAGAPLVRFGDKAAIEKEGTFADTAFFQMFSTTLLAGNPALPFANDLNAVVVTRDFGERYFGRSENVANWIGKTLQFDEKNLMVSAVIANFPNNTNYKYDFIRPYAFLIADFKPNDYWKSLEEDWGDFNGPTFLQLRAGANPAAVEQKLTTLQRAHNKFDQGSFYSLQPLSELHLNDAAKDDAGDSNVQIMWFAALFILLIACINYVNLATAKATQRAMEVGLRKAIGASRLQLMGQFLTESVLVFFISSGFALLIARLLLPLCNRVADKKLALDFSNGPLLGLLAGVLAGSLLLSAIYPALVLSGFSPLHAMRGRTVVGGQSRTALRKSLVVVQFVCSMVILVAMLVIGRQLNYIRTKNLGFDRENTFILELSEATYKNRIAFVEALKSNAAIKAVTMASDNILSLSSTTGDLKWENKPDGHNVVVAPMAISSDFLTFFNLQLKEGEGFRDAKADSTHFILNETAVRQMGLQQPVGTRITLWQIEGTVIGVVKDFHFASLRDPIRPSIFFSRPDWLGGVYVKTTGENAPKAIAAAESAWKQFDKKYPFEYKFLDDAFDKMYRKEARTAILFQSFSGIALFIACLGLFGLAAFTAERRTKEIGIRKVLGASVAGITGLLAKDFMKLVLIAIVVASPVAYYFMDQWLSDFAYRIELEWWMFAVAGVLAVAIAFLTVSFQSVRAALVNPVKSLKSE